MLSHDPWVGVCTYLKRFGRVARYQWPSLRNSAVSTTFNLRKITIAEPGGTASQPFDLMLVEGFE